MMFRCQGEAGEVQTPVLHQIDALAVDVVPLQLAELFCRVYRPVVVLSPQIIRTGSHRSREDQTDQEKEKHGKLQLPGR